MPRPPYSRPIRDRILFRAACEARSLSSEENKEIARERAKLAKSGYRLLPLMDEDERMIEKLIRLIETSEECRREHGNRKIADATAMADEAAQRRSVDRQNQHEVEEEDAISRRKRRQRLREELLQSGCLISYLLAP